MRYAIALVLAANLGVSGCATTDPGEAAPGSATHADPGSEKLASVLTRGTLVLSTDPDYAPQSSLVVDAERSEGTRCAPNQLTASEVEGFDVDTGILVAEALGVEPCFVEASFSEITAGDWNGRWDVAWSSGALTEERMTRLYVTQPYYSTPHAFFVPADSTVRDPADLSHRDIGVCAGCTHELYLQHELELPGATVAYAVEDARIVTFDAEPAGLAATAAGELDAFLSGEPVGREAIEGGAALRMLVPPAFVTQKTGYLDRGSRLSQAAFAERINDVLGQLHADGTLARLSERYFGVDYTADARAFDLSALDQTVT